MIGPISAYGTIPINQYSYIPSQNAMGAANTVGLIGVNAGTQTDNAQEAKGIVNPGESEKVAPGRKSSPAECETCRERKYQDGSDEMVSFKSASHISPNAAGTAVRAHEQEHVSNAYKKASQNNGKVVSCSVSIHTAICPECGRSYVSGGTTSTSIKYSNESNPYTKNMMAQHADALVGANFDMGL